MTDYKETGPNTMATKALITGISGMVGSHLADYLLDNTDWDIPRHDPLAKSAG